MEKIQLKHPEGKKAISMDKNKYEALKTSFISSLKVRKAAPFEELLTDVVADLKKENIKIEGVIKWNLFWVTLDMEARNDLKKDKTVSPFRYSLA
ncbi:MAG TPA: hypothetical protein VK668_06690 [Mucilaginibacter sp.]|nr:hypothetical protein [Mucilaginibacter sp.]